MNAGSIWLTLPRTCSSNACVLRCAAARAQLHAMDGRRGTSRRMGRWGFRSGRCLRRDQEDGLGGGGVVPPPLLCCLQAAAQDRVERKMKIRVSGSTVQVFILQGGCFWAILDHRPGWKFKKGRIYLASLYRYQAQSKWANFG
jgi:hypothetical protein